MMSEYYTYECKYKHKFPVDEFDRPGGMFSMADLPINGHKVLEREGIVTAQDSKQKLYQVEDKEKGWTFAIPFKDVIIGDQIPVEA
tara:strand:- start:703 stop:960 length:258 start_codon:yes stop_codon:yes gene_type:complete